MDEMNREIAVKCAMIDASGIIMLAHYYDDYAVKCAKGVLKSLSPLVGGWLPQGITKENLV